jgi:cyclopropane fatty-acyl-phospholipid synthase-like methyltransferase
MLRPPASSDGPIWDVWLSAFHAPTLAVADELGLFAALTTPASAAELARQLSIEERATESILAVLATLGFTARLGDRFQLTDVARTYLLPDSPFYWGAFLERIRTFPIECKKLVGALRAGAAASAARVSGELWRAPQPPAAALVSFTRGMHAHSFALAMRAVPSFRLAPQTRMLDVAGGSGSYSIAAALHDASMHCTLLDLPVVCDVAREYIASSGVGDRVETRPGDMFAEAWPTGFDRIFMSDIFHDWDDERCRDLAARASAALPSGGQFLVHEMVLNEAKDGPRNAAAYSMVMVFVAEGRQRSTSELFELLSAVGFRDLRANATLEGYALVAGTKP